jgi:mono/diheme cytochrome c family protein
MKSNAAKFLGLALFVLAAMASTLMVPASQPAAQDLKRGEYLVKGGGCGDCHTTKKMGPSGPEPDQAFQLAGHPEAMVMPPAPKLPAGPWIATVAATMTAWAGPWGVSFTSNLTADPETGLGKWTSATFIDTIRSGRVMGKGRQLLPPMPYVALRNLTDDDLRAIFVYLQSIPKLKNRVPDPIAPMGEGKN